MTDEELNQHESEIWKATQRFIEQHPYDYKALFNPPCLCDECKARLAVETNFLPDWGF